MPAADRKPGPPFIAEQRRPLPPLEAAGAVSSTQSVPPHRAEFTDYVVGAGVRRSTQRDQRWPRLGFVSPL
jgi:hypothetical protein